MPLITNGYLLINISIVDESTGDAQRLNLGNNA